MRSLINFLNSENLDSHNISTNSIRDRLRKNIDSVKKQTPYDIESLIELEDLYAKTIEYDLMENSIKNLTLQLEHSF